MTKFDPAALLSAIRAADEGDDHLAYFTGEVARHFKDACANYVQSANYGIGLVYHPLVRDHKDLQAVRNDMLGMANEVMQYATIVNCLVNFVDTVRKDPEKFPLAAETGVAKLLGATITESYLKLFERDTDLRTLAKLTLQMIGKWEPENATSRPGENLSNADDLN